MFNRLALSVNQQFFNAANYELHTRLNANKMIIAMSEYMRFVSLSYGNSPTDGNPHFFERRLNTIVIPNIGTLVPEAFRLFPHGYIC
jgi:hypothetical protein